MASLQGWIHGVSRQPTPPHPTTTTTTTTTTRSTGEKNQSPKVSSEALPPAAVVFTVTVFSVAKRSR